MENDPLGYPPVTESSKLFQHGHGYEVPEKVHKWEWSTTFGRWSALVTFADGWHGWTYPKPENTATQKIKVQKTASGYSTEYLPGQIFKTKSSLLVALAKKKGKEWDPNPFAVCHTT